MMVRLAAICVTLVLLLGCGRGAPPASRDSTGGSAAAGASSASSAVRPNDWFVDKSEETGLRFGYFNGMSGDYYFPEMLPGGVALFDYDNDGDLDAYLAQGMMLNDTRTAAQAVMPPLDSQPLKGRLFRNDLKIEADGRRTLHFTDVTAASGIDAAGYGMGVAAADFDHNGCVDLFLTFFGAGRLLRNNCNGTFTDVSRGSGIDATGWSVSASFVDYDRDGWLDLYVGNYVQYEVKADRACTGLTGKRDYCTPKVYAPQPDRLYRNAGKGTFTDVTAKALVGGPFGPALGVVSADFNNDGWPDIYVANDGKENLLWMNQRNGTMKNTGLLSGSALSADGKPQGSMGVDAGDFDNDGDDDLFTTQLPTEGGSLYANSGSALFDDVSGAAGLHAASLGYTGFGTAFFDFDNDGWLDILAVNGAIEAIKGKDAERFPYDERKLLFRNLRNGRFEDVSGQAGAVFTRSEVSRGAAFGDIDNDGDVDILVGQINHPAQVLINNIGNRNHWIGLRLVSGPEPARDMLGAIVDIVRTKGPTLRRRVHTDGSYASASDPRVLAGLGESTEAPVVRVRWPDGKTEEWPGAAIDRWTTLRQGSGTAR
jgi:hypothetical protein